MLVSHYYNTKFQFIDVYWKTKDVIPRYGAVLFNREMTHILLVKGYFAEKNNWYCPKGQIDAGETPLSCAIKEVYQETGFDISNNVHRNVKFQFTATHGTVMTFFAVTNVNMDYPFKPKLNKEIGGIMWYPISKLPIDIDNLTQELVGGFSAKNFINVINIMDQILDFKNKYESQNNCFGLDDNDSEWNTVSKKTTCKPVIVYEYKST